MNGKPPGLAGLVATDTGFRESPSASAQRAFQARLHAEAGSRDFAQLLDWGLMGGINGFPGLGTLRFWGSLLFTSRPAPQTRQFPSKPPPGLGKTPRRSFQYVTSLNPGTVPAMPPADARTEGPGSRRRCSVSEGQRWAGVGMAAAFFLDIERCSFSVIHPTCRS